MTFAAAPIGEDLFRALLQGTPPGTVYALIALGFVLAYKTSGVFNLAFGAQAYVSAAMYFQARTEWGWGRLPALVVSVFLLAPALGPRARAARVPPPADGLVGRQAGRGHRPHGGDPRHLRGVRRVRAGRRAHAGGHRPRRRHRLLRPVRGLPVQPRRGGRHGRGAGGDGGPGRPVPLHRHRAEDAGRRREPAHDRAQRHAGRPGLGVQLGAVQPVRGPGRRAHRPPVQHARRPRLLQPRRRRHRRRGRRPAGQPAPRLPRRAGARHPHRPGQHVPAAVVGRPPAAGHDRGERHAGDAVPGAVRPAGPVAGAAGGAGAGRPAVGGRPAPARAGLGASAARG